MALGNGNPKEGDKGSNFFWELKVLQGLEAIAEAIEAGGGGGGGGGITGLTGDVTAGPGTGIIAATIGALKVTTPKIANNAVTFGKMQLITNRTFLGNDTALPGTDVVKELQLSHIPYFSAPITGIANNANFLRGDGQWITPASFTLQNYRTDLTPRSFVNFEGSLNAIDEGAVPNRVTITGPTTNQGLITNYTADNSSPAFEFGMSVMNNSSIPANTTVTNGLFNSDRFINLKKNRLVIIKDENIPGTGIVLTPTVVGGQVTNIAITNPGTGSYFPQSTNGTTYASTSVTITGGNPTTPATASAFFASPITDVIITNGGSNYPAGTTVTFPAPPVGGTQALGTPIIKNGVIVGVTITNPGAGYDPFGAVTFTGVGGSGATARFAATRAVPYRINITNPGAGYTSVPTATIPVGVLQAEAAAVEIKTSLETVGGANSTLLRVVGNSAGTTAEFRNFGNSSVITARPFGGGFSFDSQHNSNVGGGLRITNPAVGIQVTSHTSTGFSASSGTPFTRSIDVQNTAINNTAGIAAFQQNGTPSGNTLVQPTISLYRANNIYTVVAPTVPNNTTNISGVGSTIDYYNPLYNVPTRQVQSGVYVGSITGSTLTVTSVTSGIVDISQLISGTGIPLETYITAQTSGTPNGIGTYTINPPVSSPTGSITITGSALGWATQAVSTELTGLWRDAAYQTAQGGFDISLATAKPTNDPIRFTHSTRNKVFRLRADGQVTFPQGLPTSATGLVTGDLYTQTTAELGIAGGGTQKVICIV